MLVGGIDVTEVRAVGYEPPAARVARVFGVGDAYPNAIIPCPGAGAASDYRRRIATNTASTGEIVGVARPAFPGDSHAILVVIWLTSRRSARERTFSSPILRRCVR